MILIFLIQAIIFGSFCAFIAREKNRYSIGWFFLGFLFSLIALLALIAVPTAPKLDDPRQSNKRTVALLGWIFLYILIGLILIGIVIGIMIFIKL
ncbi:MAG: hypothetical protein C0417_06135 [Chlorobiaceae bacterium]|nr:hypothetical protein [Chlorobiaceae bacterium]